MRTKLLQTWIEELKEESKNYYREKLNEYNELKKISHAASDLYYKFKKENYDKYGNDKDTITKVYEATWQQLEDAGYHFDKEHFINRFNNGTHYTVEFKGKTLHSYFQGYDRRGNRYITYGIVQYYYLNFETKALYNLFDNDKDIDTFVEKNVEAYVQKILDKIKVKYGETLTVTDSVISNVASVIFNCEKGDCYLERIFAGGYNIQVLHNRILLKELKK